MSSRVTTNALSLSEPFIDQLQKHQTHRSAAV